MIERLQPVFARPNSRTGRYYVRDNFLRTWLAALATPVAARSFRPLSDLLDDAERRLRQSEGAGFERLVRALYEERSRRGMADFHLSVTSPVGGIARAPRSISWPWTKAPVGYASEPAS
jgi:uncharacterized protein